VLGYNRPCFAVVKHINELNCCLIMIFILNFVSVSSLNSFILSICGFNFQVRIVLCITNISQRFASSCVDVMYKSDEILGGYLIPVARKFPSDGGWLVPLAHVVLIRASCVLVSNEVQTKVVWLTSSCSVIYS
jgi:hypothetical protein